MPLRVRQEVQEVLRSQLSRPPTPDTYPRVLAGRIHLRVESGLCGRDRAQEDVDELMIAPARLAQQRRPAWLMSRERQNFGTSPD